MMSSVVSTNDGGSTTVTSATNALEDGFLSISSSSTGEINKPVVLDGIFQQEILMEVLRQVRY